MKKSIYIAALAALTLTACSSDDKGIFDKSAADRLEQYKAEYAEVLTENGGLWTMEYFSNEEEPGYVFVMKFDTDGSVKIAANHKWIENTYKEEVSLWKMIADNGPVLSFNSYNTVFHILADPANIEGPDAPLGETGDDVNETGFGHAGDYEFQVMEVSDDHNTVRLLGKKRMYDIYLRRLDPSTDVNAYMDEYKKVESSLFCKEINSLIFTDEDGERYVVNDAYTGVMSVYPEAGDPVDQTRKANFIITNTGIRFLNPFHILTSKGEEKEINEFTFVGNHGLASVGNTNSLLNAGSFTDIIYKNMVNWKVDLSSLSGSVKDAVDAFVSQLKTLYNYKGANLTDMAIDYDKTKKSYVLRINLKISNKSSEVDKFLVSFNETDGSLSISIDEAYDNNSQLALNAYTSLQDLFRLLTSSSVSYTAVSDCGPKSMTLDINGGALTINVY
ncbi:MAG: DUF4302 domain-containing protein [Muribaculaceae bacterium]|nr:DUF4302 domain-containing protein [Muribaculaceae bacterium]